MTRLLTFLLFATLVSSVSAQTDYQIGPIKIDRMRSTVDGRNKTLEYATTRVSVPAETVSHELYVVAYYFSESGAYVGGRDQGQFTETKEKDRVATGPNGGIVSMPAKLEANKWYEVKFGAPVAKWNRVIVVVGKKGDMVGRIHPKAGDWTKLDFPDKASVRMSQ
jgi:hypothetical protein